jgi:hypothetical protein
MSGTVNGFDWVLEGHVVEGVYLGEHRVRGQVVESRVKYGGGIQHTVVLEAPIVIYSKERERILLNHKELTHVVE